MNLYSNRQLKQRLVKVTTSLIPSKTLRSTCRTILNRNDIHKSNMEQMLLELQIKSSLENDIFQFNDIKMYIPDFPLDHIQKTIANTNNFYDIKSLEYLNKYINNDTTILEIGANIGNHAVYWAKQQKVNKIYSFEPILKTFKRLEQNIKINNLKNVEIFNFAAGDKDSQGSIDFYNVENTGATSIKESDDGDLKIVKIDNLKFDNKIDFIKIDVEGFEINVLKGMTKLLKEQKPVVYIESAANNIDEVLKIFSDCNYENKGCPIEPNNYIFEAK